MKESLYEGGALQDLNEHLSKIYETCQYCCLIGVTEDQKMLKLFPMSLARRAKDWLLALPSITIATRNELKEKFLERFFSITKFIAKMAEITHFVQKDEKSMFENVSNSY